MTIPEIRYAMADDGVRIAYQELGSGPPVIFVLPFFSHIEVQWEQPLITRMFDRMADYLGVVLLENRGSGLSDSTDHLPTLEDRVRDIEAVATAVNIDRFSLLGPFAGAQMCVTYAAKHPEQVDSLVLANPRVGRSVKESADLLEPDAPGPVAYTYQTQREMEEAAARLGSGLTEADLDRISNHSPSALAHPEYLRWLPRYERMWGSRESVRRQAESIGPLDIADIAPYVQTPTLITHIIDSGIIHAGYGRLLNRLMPNSKLMEFEGRDHFYWLGHNWREVIDAQIEFIAGAPVDTPMERRFAVVLFTDIVSSTRESIAVGDRGWREQLDAHDRTAQRVVSNHAGTLIKSTGDGLLAIFDTPTQAVVATAEVRHDLSRLGIRIRAGLHAGEVEIRGGDISGAVVNLAARVEQEAEDDDIYVTKAVRDMLLGSDHRFASVGEHSLKGFDEPWHLYRFVDDQPSG